MHRREFLAGSVATMVGVALAKPSQAAYLMKANGLKQVYVSTPSIIKQNCAQWCWAASISMIFKMSGHYVDQQVIVAQTFGGIVCQPAGAGVVIANALSRPWVDMATGATFQCHVKAAFDAMAGVNFITNDMIVQELANDRPLIYCNQHHAMVLVSMDYFDSPGGPQPVAAGVLDPWPGSPDYHNLTPAELVAAPLGGQMSFLLSVDIF